MVKHRVVKVSGDGNKLAGLVQNAFGGFEEVTAEIKAIEAQQKEAKEEAVQKNEAQMQALIASVRSKQEVEAENENLKTQLAQAKTEIDDLKTHLVQARDEIDSLKHELAQAQQVIVK